VVVKAAAFGLCLILSALPSAARPSENLVAKREACRLEAKKRIVATGKIQVDDYRRLVDRRAAYVGRCLNRTLEASSNVPLPAQEVLDDAKDAKHEQVIAPARKEPRRITKRVERKKQKVATVRTIKGKKTLKKKKLRFSSHRNK
jgi:hypothetical protein